MLFAMVSRYLFIDWRVWYCGCAKSFSVSSAFVIDSDAFSLSPKTVPVPVFAFWAEKVSDVVVVFVFPPIIIPNDAASAIIAAAVANPVHGEDWAATIVAVTAADFAFTASCATNRDVNAVDDAISATCLAIFAI